MPHPSLSAPRPLLRGVALAFLTVLAAKSTPAQQERRPNIVFLFSDDHAAHAVSAYRPHLAYGGRFPRTPQLDRLAAGGMLFQNAFVTNSICGPSRATLLTGQYGHLNGVMTNREELHPTHLTFPTLVQAAGYRTALFGKWHLRAQPQGFDHHEILAGQGPYYNPRLITGTDTTAYEGYTLDVVTQRALDWATANRLAEQPFMLMLHFNAPHRFWDPGPEQLGMYRDTIFAEPPTFWDDGSGRASPARNPEMKVGLDLFDRDLKLETPSNLTAAQLAAWNAAYDEENEAFRAAAPAGDDLTRWRYQRYMADYARVVSALDDQVGRVLDYLEQNGMAENTIVIYASDQGFFLGDHGWFDKRWMYEESLRMPLLVRWPGTVAPGSVNRDLVMNLDLAETFLDIAGAAIPEQMQGLSLAPLLRGETPAEWRDAIYYQYFEYPGWHSVRRQYGVRTQRYKLIHYYEVDEWELFDLERDPEELRSVYGSPQYARITADLLRRLGELRAQYAVPGHDPVPYRPSDVAPEWRRQPPPPEHP